MLLRGSRDFESEAAYGQFLEQVLERGNHGRQEKLAAVLRDRGVVLDYRHVIDHLLRKPSAFERYRYREQLFPGLLFRQAYDHLVTQQGQRRGSVDYLRLLKLASGVGESQVEVMLADYLSPPYPVWSVEGVGRILRPRPQWHVELRELQPECRSYGALLSLDLEVSHVG